MLEKSFRKLSDPVAMRVADALAWRQVRPSWVLLLGFAMSVAAVPAIASGRYILGLVLIALGRSVDELGRAIVRQTRASDFGAFLEVALEYIYCAAIPFAFAIADPSRALAACFFIFAFTVSAATYLSYARFAAKLDGVKGATHIASVTDGAEAFIAFAIACIHPEWFSIVAYIFGAICFVSAGLRFAAALSELRTL